jgi:hypothetical protein
MQPTKQVINATTNQFKNKQNKMGTTINQKQQQKFNNM